MRRQILILFLVLAAFSQNVRSADQVLLITLDGLRWQELFGGADAELINDPTFTRDPEATKKEFWRDTPEARRQALMPFFWSTIAAQGTLYGNRNLGSPVAVRNDQLFSYPG
ncbi:MAG: phosphoglyceromutase, partial [Luminiphilus sp.]